MPVGGELLFSHAVVSKYSNDANSCGFSSSVSIDGFSLFRSADGPATTVRSHAGRKVIASNDPNIPVTDIITQEQVRDKNISGVGRQVCGVQLVGHSGGGAVMHRALWPDGVPCHATHRRDWHPHGSRRNALASCWTGPSRSADTPYRRRGVRRAFGARVNEANSQPPLRRAAFRPIHALRGGCPSSLGWGRCFLDPHQASRGSRSHERS